MTLANVTGNATIEAVADRAHLRVRLHIEPQGSAQDAYVAYAHRLGTARTLLEGRPGVEHWTGTPRTWAFRDDQQDPRHCASGALDVTVTDLSQVADLVADLMAHPDLAVDPVRWDVSNRRDLERQARVAAIHAAREVADDYAAALDAIVLGVQSLADTAGPARGGWDSPFAAAAATPLGGPSQRPALDLSCPPPITVHGAVTVAYRIG